MAELVALDLPAGPGFVDALRAAWDAGDAVLPIDPRLPGPAVDGCSTASGPRRWWTATGRHRRAGGRPVEPGRRPGGRHQRDDRRAQGGGPRPMPPSTPRPGPPPPAWPSTRTGTVGWPASRWPTSAGCRWSPGPWSPGRPAPCSPGFDAAEVERLGRRRGHPRLAGRHRPRPDRRLGLPGRAARGCRPTDVAAGQRRHHLRHDRDRLGLRLRRPGPRRGRAPHRRRHARGATARCWCGADAAACYRDGTDPRVPDGWLPTGDGGRIGADGTLPCSAGWPRSSSPEGRRSGPFPSTGALGVRPAVAEVAVWKRPDPEWGERVVAWVVPVRAPGTRTRRRPRAGGRAEFAPYAAPRELVVPSRCPAPRAERSAGRPVLTLR